MMNKNSTLCGLFASVIFIMGLISCDDDAAGPQFGAPQTPIKTFTNSLGPVSSSIGGTSELSGCLMRFNNSGRISQLCGQAPSDKAYDLILWDVATNSMITSVTVNDEAGDLTCVDIADVEVAAGRELAITITTNHIFFWDAGMGNIFYPATVGDVTITGFRFTRNPIGAFFPVDIRNDTYHGIADVVFEPELE